MPQGKAACFSETLNLCSPQLDKSPYFEVIKTAHVDAQPGGLPFIALAGTNALDEPDADYYVTRPI